MKIAVPKETQELEKRVALVPETVKKLVDREIEVVIETGAGVASAYLDEAYTKVGATVASSYKEAINGADLVVHVQPPEQEKIDALSKDQVWISFLWALSSAELVDKLKAQNVTAIGMEAIPRITRAQKMDALSSMSSIAGYKAVLLGANHLGKYMPMLMTAAGTIPPAKVLILGAGVAGLQAIATARRLGAVVEAFDIRPAVKEQVESLGAKFIEVPLEEENTETKGGYAKELSERNQEKQREVIHEHVKKSDIVITTALIPGKKAPLLVTKAMVEDMQPGSVVVDLAAEQGGNCEETVPGEVAQKHNVSLVGLLNIPSLLPFHSSLLYSRNAYALIDHLYDEEKKGVHLDFEDEITKQAVITHGGEISSPLLKS